MKCICNKWAGEVNPTFLMLIPFRTLQSVICPLFLAISSVWLGASSFHTSGLRPSCCWIQGLQNWNWFWDWSRFWFRLGTGRFKCLGTDSLTCLYIKFFQKKWKRYSRHKDQLDVSNLSSLDQERFKPSLELLFKIIQALMSKRFKP